MLDAVVAKVASLFFGFAQPTGQNVQRGQPGKDVVCLEMCFLHMALLREKPDIDAIAGTILADPHRVFRRVRSPRRMEDVTFQGQQAEVVIVSMTTSIEESLPRFIDFLYSKHRLNVALSRARCLALLVANPELMSIKCTRPEQMALVNALCWVREYSEQGRNGVP